MALDKIGDMHEQVFVSERGGAHLLRNIGLRSRETSGSPRSCKEADNWMVWSAPATFIVTIGGRTITCPAGSHGFNVISNVCDPLDDNNHGTHVPARLALWGTKVWESLE